MRDKLTLLARISESNILARTWVGTTMDKISKEDRSRNMVAVKNKNTKPEMRVRSAIHRAGFRYSLHSSKLPGKPDIVLRKYKSAVFVHGCFWHGHDCPRGRRPTTNVDFWEKKLSQNVSRDERNRTGLQNLGWRVFVIWECTLEEDVSLAISHLENRRMAMSRDVPKVG